MKPVHFLGVNGVGMSALAHLLLEQKIRVTGEDLSDFNFLEECGVEKTEEIPKESIIVYSSAIPLSRVTKLRQAHPSSQIMHRSLMAKILMQQKKGILVAGSHGKTTTSSLLLWVLKYAGLDPSYAIGGFPNFLKKNGGMGTGQSLIFEADESDGSFLNYQGESAIITNIGGDHLSFWKTKEKLIEGFKDFALNVKNKDTLFWCADDPILSQLNLPGVSYGLKGDIKLLGFEYQKGRTFFRFSYLGKTYNNFQIPFFGKEFVLNALGVFGMAVSLGANSEQIREAFQTFKGVKRRQEKIGKAKGIAFFDDYAHHPTEIKCLIDNFKKIKKEGNLVAVFQPHRFTRTRDCLFEFKEALKNVDILILTSIYSAGEEPIDGISDAIVLKEIDNGKAHFVNYEELPSFLTKILNKGDICLTIGAGNISKIGYKTLQCL